jgi:predicted DNA-binding transcriptional regulator YafY
MKAEIRGALAREPFEQKIRKTGQLLQLAGKLKAQRAVNNVDSAARGLRAHENASRNILAAEQHPGVHRDPLIISAIRRKAVLQFSYNGKLRTVEPQTYGLSTTGREVLRAFERPATDGLKRPGTAKLFDLKKISGLRESGLNFKQALPAHNPDDSAMVEIFATLPAPTN